MLLRFKLLVFSFLFVSGFVFGQKRGNQNKRVIQRQLISAQTGLPLQYVQIKLVDSDVLFLSDDKGIVTLPETITTDSIEFSRLSIIQKRASASYVIENPIIELDESSYSLGDFDVFVNLNDGLQMMTQVKDSLSVTNPSQVVDYSCMVYNKLVFDIDTIMSKDGEKEGFDEFNNDNSSHLLLIESLSEIKHGVPDYYNERIITGRVSGFKQPSLEYIASQLKPFMFYNKYITILSEDYLNPVSILGLKLYQFQIIDSINNQSDVFIKVKFKPKSKLVFNGLNGYFLIDKSTLSIVGIEASGLQEGSSNRVFMTQNFKKTALGLWFPSLLEAKIELKNVIGDNGEKLLISGTYKSYLTAINFDYKWSKSDDSPVILQQPTQYRSSDTIKIENYRAVELTQNDSVTFVKIDSLGSANKFDKVVYFGRSFAEGFIPISFVKIDFTKILDYNQREGLTIGFGLYTSAMLSPNYTFGGYCRYGFIDNSSKYGASGSYTFSLKNQTKASILFRSDVIATNNYNFLDGYPTGSSEAYKRFSISEMDLYKSVSADIETRPIDDFKVNFGYSFYESTTTNSNFYPYIETMSTEFKRIAFNEYGLRLRWVYKEKFKNIAFGNIPIPSSSPYVWINYRYIDGILSDINFQATKIEGQIEKVFKSGGNMETSVRLTYGKIFGETPSSLYYSSFGNYSNRVGIESAYSFATMRSSEFYADEFALAFLRHKIPLLSNSIHKFKPILYLNSSLGFGNLDHNKELGFSKGYYESGFILDNLFKTVFVKYGLAGYYRYGHYHHSNEWDNVAIKVSIDFSF